MWIKKLSFCYRLSFPLTCRRYRHDICDGGRNIKDADSFQLFAGFKPFADKEHGDSHILGHIRTMSSVMAAVVSSHNDRIFAAV